jgi:hypothetical protein
VPEFLKKQQASNHNLIFGSTDRNAFINAFDPDWSGAVPYTVLISPEGKIIYRETGSIDSPALKRTILKAPKRTNAMVTPRCDAGIWHWKRPPGCIIRSRNRSE